MSILNDGDDVLKANTMRALHMHHPTERSQRPTGIMTMLIIFYRQGG